MARPKLDLIIADKCSHCKLKSTDICEGQFLLSKAKLEICPYFIDLRSTKIIKKDIEVPFPVTKKVKK